jgi:hypothetical protein
MGTYDELIIREVAHPMKIDRLLFFASKSKRRPQLIEAIHTSEFLDRAAIVELANPDFSAETVLVQMLSLGPDQECYALSALGSLDGKVLPLKEALAEIVGYTVETVLFCPVRRVGYYEGGHAKDRCILRGRSYPKKIGP